MRYSYLENPIGAYSKFLVLISIALISIALKYLGCGSGLAGNCGAVILY